MKRAFLIAGGTVGGLGAVLAITPPQLSSPELATGGALATPTGIKPANKTAATPAATKSATPAKATTSAKPAASKSATPVATKSATATATKAAATVATKAADPTPTATPTKTADPTPASTGVTGEFTGSAINVSYGIVQVKITVVNGKITDAVAVQAPSGRNDRYTNFALPILKRQTLAAQSDRITGASGASYTSYGWYKSLQSALTKAGML